MALDIAERMRTVQRAVKDLKIENFDPPGELAQNYGLMKFDKNELDSNTTLPQYIRLSGKTDADTVVNFMQQGWLLPTPDLIISITGGAKNFDMSARLRKVFQRGLVAAAVTTNAWLITAGTNAGVVKEVGEALNNYRYKNQKRGLEVPCIGIGSWGYTSGNEQLAEGAHYRTPSIHTSRASRSLMGYSQSSTVNAVRMDVGDQYCVRSYVVTRNPEKRCDLEPNHTHFLLFDDGRAKADSVLDLRASIETRCRAVNTDPLTGGGPGMLIPIVMVLVEGGPSSLRTICKALDAKTPVVVVKDSGRGADLVADLHALFTESDSGGGNGQTTRPKTAAAKGDAYQAEINAIFAKAHDKTAWADEVREDLCKTLNEHKQLVTIFKFDGKKHNGNLEDAILEALLDAAKHSEDSKQFHRTTELKLALAWHKFDYAKKYVLTDTTIAKWEVNDLRRALFDALRRGHVDFVELLIEFGTSLENLTVHDLRRLYTTKNMGEPLPLRTGDKNITDLRDRYYAQYFGSMDNIDVRGKDKLGKDDEPLGRDAQRELFLWAVALDRLELATYLCSKTLNSFVAPLFAAQMYRRASREVIDSEMKQKYENNADVFDAHATAIIDRCFDNDENFAVDMLKRPAPAFFDAPALPLALKADCRSFLASKCVQKHLDNEWFGFINYRRRAINFRIFLCSLFLPLLPIFCFFLPYVQKHKKIARSTRDRSKIGHPIAIQTVTDSDQGKKKHSISWFDKLWSFYHAPIVRFYYYMIFFVIFLILFSYVLLVDYFPLNIYNERRSGYATLQIPITEVILHICIWCLIVEELRQFIFIESRREYLSEVWNWIDMLAIAFYLVGFITRFFVIEAPFTVSKIFMCLDLILWYIRTLHLFAAYEKLGPKLVMIFNTMRDLIFFICFILIFLLGFSVASWSLITTNDQVVWNYASDGSLESVSVSGGGSGIWNWQIIRHVLNYGVWKVFGQVDPIDGTDAYSTMAFVLAMLFLAIANVLLLNVLVALFNVTIQNVENQSHKLWRYQRFLIVFEYNDKPPLPPPFNVVYYVYMVLRAVYRRCRARCHRRLPVINEATPMESVAQEGPPRKAQFKITDAMQRESAIADDYWQHIWSVGKKGGLEETLNNVERQLHDLKERLQAVNAAGTGANPSQTSNNPYPWLTTSP